MCTIFVYNTIHIIYFSDLCLDYHQGSTRGCCTMPHSHPLSQSCFGFPDNLQTGTADSGPVTRQSTSVWAAPDTGPPAWTSDTRQNPLWAQDEVSTVSFSLCILGWIYRILVSNIAESGVWGMVSLLLEQRGSKWREMHRIGVRPRLNIWNTRFIYEYMFWMYILYYKCSGHIMLNVTQITHLWRVSIAELACTIYACNAIPHDFEACLNK